MDFYNCHLSTALPPAILGTASIAASPSGATESSNTVTIRTSQPHGFSTGQTVTVAGVQVSGYNGTFTITSVGPTGCQNYIPPNCTTFNYTDSNTGLGASGGGTATVIGITESGNTVTATTTVAHGLTVGQQVYVSGVGVAGYNGVYTVTKVLSPTVFQYSDTNTGLAASGSGQVTGASNGLARSPYLFDFANITGWTTISGGEISGPGSAAINGMGSCPPLSVCQQLSISGVASSNSVTGLSMANTSDFYGGVSAASESGNLVTITMDAVYSNPAANQAATISGIGVTGYDGTYTVLSVGSASCNINNHTTCTAFTYIDPTNGLASTGNGTGGIGAATVYTSTAGARYQSGASPAGIFANSFSGASAAVKLLGLGSGTAYGSELYFFDYPSDGGISDVAYGTHLMLPSMPSAACPTSPNCGGFRISKSSSSSGRDTQADTVLLTLTTAGQLQLPANGALISGGYLYDTYNTSGSNPSLSQGLATGWNYTNVGGEADLFQNTGAGTTGGFNYYNWNGSAATLNWKMQGSDTSFHSRGPLTFQDNFSSAYIALAGSPTGLRTWTFQDATDTVLGRATTDTFTNKTFDTAGTGNGFKINGTSLTAVSGTGSTVALATSPSFSGATVSDKLNFTVLSNQTCSPGNYFIQASLGSGGVNACNNGYFGGFQPLTFNASGTVQNPAHIVVDSVTLSSGSATVTFYGGAVFTSTYTCAANDQTTPNQAVEVVQGSSSVTFYAGSGTDVVRFICAGI